MSKKVKSISDFRYDTGAARVRMKNRNEFYSTFCERRYGGYN